MARRVTRYVDPIAHERRLAYWKQYNRTRRGPRTRRSTPSHIASLFPSRLGITRRIQSSFRSSPKTRDKAIKGHARIRRTESTFQKMRLSRSLKRAQLSLKSTSSLNLAKNRRRERLSGSRTRKGL